MTETLKSIVDLAKLGCIDVVDTGKRFEGDPVYLIEGREYLLHKEDDPEDIYVWWFLMDFDSMPESMTVDVMPDSMPKGISTKLLRQDVESRNNLTPMQQHFLSNDDEFKARFMFSRI